MIGVLRKEFVLDESAVNTAKIAFAVRQDGRVIAALGATVVAERSVLPLKKENQ